MPNLYIIAGCNGAGKTTASFTVLPEMLGCEEFINADEIARGLAPLNPGKASIEAGRIMLKKIDGLIMSRQNFAFETTLASRSFANTIKKAGEAGYQTTLIFFYLESVELAIKRVKNRVLEGGHDVHPRVIKRRYVAGVRNLFELYIPICNYWMIFNNSKLSIDLIAEGYFGDDEKITDISTFVTIKNKIKNGKYE